MTVKTQVQFFQVVMPCGVVAGYHHFCGPCCLKMEAAWTLEMMIFCHTTTWHHNPEELTMNSTFKLLYTQRNERVHICYYNLRIESHFLWNGETVNWFYCPVLQKIQFCQVQNLQSLFSLVWTVV